VPGPEWSSNAHFDTQAAFTRHLGRYATTDSVTLTLTPFAGGDSLVQYSTTFDLFCIDGWKGAAGPDYFQLYVNGTQFFQESVSNLGGTQSFRAADVGPAPMVYGSAWDSIYRNITINFTVDSSATEIKLKYRGQLTQAMTTESWGIDNVRVDATVVPAPGQFVLLALGGLVAARRKR
jgi:hypothetical protein